MDISALQLADDTDWQEMGISIGDGHKIKTSAVGWGGSGGSEPMLDGPSDSEDGHEWVSMAYTGPCDEDSLGRLHSAFEAAGVQTTYTIDRNRTR